MLIISRTRDQQILIGEDIVLTLIAVRGKRARIGIDAPRELRVSRRDEFVKSPKHSQAREEKENND